jgi:hypothetical protein
MLATQSSSMTDAPVTNGSQALIDKYEKEINDLKNELEKAELAGRWNLVFLWEFCCSDKIICSVDTIQPEDNRKSQVCNRQIVDNSVKKTLLTHFQRKVRANLKLSDPTTLKFF